MSRLTATLLLLSLATAAVPKTYRVPPNIIGLPQDSAVKLVTDSGFTDVKTMDTFGVGAVGTVAATYPKSGYQAPTMTIWVWRGAPPDSSDTLSVIMPSMKGLHWPAAQDTLRKLGLKWITANVTTSGDSIGRVLAQDPDPGKALNRGDTVKCEVGVKRSLLFGFATTVLILIVVAVAAILLLLFRPHRSEPAQSYAMPSGKGRGHSDARQLPAVNAVDTGLKPTEIQTLHKVARDWDDSQKYWLAELKKLRDNVAQIEERQNHQPVAQSDIEVRLLQLEQHSTGRDTSAAVGAQDQAGPARIDALAAQLIQVNGVLIELRRRLARLEGAGQTPRGQRSLFDHSDLVQSYNAGLAEAERERDFRRAFKPRAVRAVTKGGDTLFVEHAGGGVIVLFSQNEWFAVPSFGVTHHYRHELEACFELLDERGGAEPSRFVQRLQSAAACEPVDDGWRITTKGALVVGS